MKTPVVLVVLVLTLASWVNSQCISANDQLTVPSRPDLTHITPFSVSLFKEVVPSSGNFIFSPYSIWTALVLAYFGSKGNTQKQMEEVLQLTNKEETFALFKGVDQLYGDFGGARPRLKHARRRCQLPEEAANNSTKKRPLSRKHSGNGTQQAKGRRLCRRRKGRRQRNRRKGGERRSRKARRPRRRNRERTKERRNHNANFTISAANKIYVQDGFPIRPCLRRSFSREMKILDFRMSEVAARAINRFVNSTTRGKIPNLVQPSDITNSKMVLVNAVYFKGLWESQFDPKSTRQSQFKTAPDTQATVDMMRTKAKFKTGFSQDLNAEILEMPYKGGRASMVVVMPRDQNTGQELDQMFEHRLTPVTLLDSTKNLRESEIIVLFPKFKLETSLQKEFIYALIKLGIRDLFFPAADLTAFSPEGGLVLNDGIHKAVIEVNEEGAEAAAATGLTFFRSSYGRFDCNRPFLFFIRDNDANNILFMGTFRGP